MDFGRVHSCVEIQKKNVIFSYFQSFYSRIYVREDFFKFKLFLDVNYEKIIVKKYIAFLQ